jgi:hypothetical protein
MKKIVLMATFLMSLSYAATAQMKFGLRLAPSLATNRVQDKKDGDGITYSNNGVGVRFSTGIIVDYFFSENAALATGLWYTAKRAGIKSEVSGSTNKYVYNTQFVQLPVSLKFFTNDLNDGMKLYFQAGTTIDVKISEKIKDWEPAVAGTPKPTEKAFIPVDLGVLLGAGVEMELSKDTKFFTGLNYNRGLLNMLRNGDNFKVRDYASSSFNLISLEAGLKF